MRLQGKTAIITGAARGIGRATAELFAREGAGLALWDTDPAGAELAARLHSEDAPARFYRVDVADAASVNEAAARSWKDFGSVEALINNAGIVRDARLLKMTEEQWDVVIQVNLKGVFLCARAVAERMAEAGRGSIANASSVVGLYGNFGQTNYVASKAGVIGMTRTWARELGRKGVRVNAVAPGFIATEMVSSVPEKVLAGMREKVPLGRLGEASEVAQVYLFLASDDSSYINGAVISVDGGLVV